MSETEWKWISAGFISQGGSSEKQPHFKRDWCNLSIALSDFKVSYIVRAYDHNHEDPPELPLTHSGMEDFERSQTAKLLPGSWDGHVIDGDGKIIDNHVVWANFAKGRLGGDNPEQIHHVISGAKVLVYASDKEQTGYIRIVRPQYTDGPYSLRVLLYMNTARLAKFAREINLPGEKPKVQVDILASLFYFRNDMGEYGDTLLLPAGAPDSAPAVISSMSVVR